MPRDILVKYRVTATRTHSTQKKQKKTLIQPPILNTQNHANKHTIKQAHARACTRACTRMHAHIHAHTRPYLVLPLLSTVAKNIHTRSTPQHTTTHACHKNKKRIPQCCPCSGQGYQRCVLRAWAAAPRAPSTPSDDVVLRQRASPLQAVECVFSKTERLVTVTGRQNGSY